MRVGEGGTERGFAARKDLRGRGFEVLGGFEEDGELGEC
jgi:hypothetical protein